jgi:peptidyl-prolyl cis-trans isomerase A (cyclophilin A)
MKTSKLILAGALTLLAGLAQAQIVRIETNQGMIRAQLDAGKSPKTVANFIAYAKAGHYNGTIFHRVIPDFMIQGGGFTKDMVQKATKPPIPLEANNGRSNLRGTLAMARTGDPNSATSQFFINVVDNNFLDAVNSRDGLGYAVFGEVIEGMEVVDKIRAQPTEAKGMHANLPVTPVLITKITVEGTKK